MNSRITRYHIPNHQRTYDNFYKYFYTSEEQDNELYDTYFNKQFYLLSDRVDGLGGRLTSLFSLIYFTTLLQKHFKRNDIPIVLHWIRNDGMGCNFNDLFETKQNKVTILEDNNFSNEWKYPHDHNKPGYFRIYRDIDHLSLYDNAKAIHIRKCIDSMFGIQESHGIKLWQNISGFASKDYVFLNESIVKRGNSLLGDIDSTKLIGIHIRGTDLPKLNLHYYINFIKTYKLQNHTFIIASQHDRDIEAFKKFLPDTTFIKQEIKINSLRISRFNHQYYSMMFLDKKQRKRAMEQDMVDFYLLSKCKLVITNSRNCVENNKEISSFIKALILFCGCRVVCLYNKSECLEHNTDVNHFIKL